MRTLYHVAWCVSCWEIPLVWYALTMVLGDEYVPPGGLAWCCPSVSQQREGAAGTM